MALTDLRGPEFAIVTGLFRRRAEGSRKRFAVQLKLGSSELHGTT
jgi:hypothetical protein